MTLPLLAAPPPPPPAAAVVEGSSAACVARMRRERGRAGGEACPTCASMVDGGHTIQAHASIPFILSPKAPYRRPWPGDLWFGDRCGGGEEAGRSGTAGRCRRHAEPKDGRREPPRAGSPRRSTPFVAQSDGGASIACLAVRRRDKGSVEFFFFLKKEKKLKRGSEAQRDAPKKAKQTKRRRPDLHGVTM